jgi:VWFA-related protein
MSTSRPVFPVVVAGLLLAVCAASPQSPPTTLQSNASLVLVDVVVTNKGKPVQGLNKSQFKVVEDGKEQTITSFEEHRPAPVPEVPRRLPPDTYSNRPDYPNSAAVNVLLLDALNTPMADQMQARQQMVDYLKTLPAGTPIAILTLASSLRIVQGPSADRSVLSAAIQGAAANSRSSPVLDATTDQALDSTVTDAANNGTSQQAVGAMQQFEADNTAMQTDRRVRLTLQAMQQLARYCSGIPTRKNLIWFSGSFPLSLDSDPSLDSPLDATRNFSEEVRETSHLLSAARVAVYPVDARGLFTLPMVDANYSESSSPNAAGSGGGPIGGGRRGTLASGMPGFAKDNLHSMKQTQAEHASMLQVAMDTGGWAFLDTNGLQQAVERIMQHGSNYYTLAYATSAKQMDGKFRKIEVRVDGVKYQLAYRSGYYADDPAKRFAFRSSEPSLVAAMVHQAPTASEVLFTVRALPSNAPFHDSPGQARTALTLPRKRYTLSFNVDPHGLDMNTLPDGSSRAQMEFIAIVYGRDGKPLNRSDTAFAFHLRADQYSAAMQHGIPRQVDLDLPAGHIFLRVAVHDLLSNRMGSTEFPLNVAAP